MNNHSFAELLRQQRLARGLTQDQLAERSGLSGRGISDLERGVKQTPRATTVQLLARGLKLSEHEAAAMLRAAQPYSRAVGFGHVRHNLPLTTTSFVGRELEIYGLVDRLGTARLLTLVGPGGVGKTRLALQVGTRALETYPDGVWLAELAPLSDARTVVDTVAAVLDIHEHGRTPIASTLADALRAQNLLLILDNCEHVLDGCAELVHALLRTCPGVTILATSREPLHLSAEIRWAVPPLSRAAASGASEEVSEAVQLFVERARAVHPGFALTAANGDVVAEVCARLDGLPLAIELAAARLATLPLPAILRQLQSTGSLPLLTGGPRDAPARLQTLRAAITWSYDLLCADERTLFRRLAPFRGCTLDAVTSVCVNTHMGSRSMTVDLPSLELDALAGLTSLVDKNLLHVEDDGHGQAWYVMLETVRELALELLEASPEADVTWRRLSWYYLRLAEHTEAGLQSMREDVFLDRLEREHGNFRAVLDWCQSHGYAEASLRLAVGLLWFWGVRGHIQEGRTRLEALLRRFPLRTSNGHRASVHAKALDAAGRLAASQGDFLAANAFGQQSLDLAESLEDVGAVCDALDGLAFGAREQGDYATARSCLERSLSRMRALAAAQEPAAPAVTARIATTLHGLGELAHDLGDDQSATALIGESTSLWAQIGDQTPIAQNDIELSAIAYDSGDYEQARALAERSIASHERGHDRRGLAIALMQAGLGAVGQREFSAAFDLLYRGLRINQEIGELAGIAFALVRFALLASAEGHHARALRLAGAADALREQAGTPLASAYQQRLDAQLEPARRALGRLADAATAEGRLLSLEEAIVEARATAPARPANEEVGDVSVLTAREREVAILIGRGYSNRRIATHLVVGESTVATHVQHILAKLGLGSRAQVAVWGAQHGLLDEHSA